MQVIIKCPVGDRTPNPLHKVIVIKSEDGGAYEEVRTIREGESLPFYLHKGVTLTVREE